MLRYKKRKSLIFFDHNSGMQNMYRKNNFSFLNQLPVLKTLNAHIFTLYVVELYVLKRDLSTDLLNCYSIVALSNALTKSYNAAVSKFLIFLLYRS